MKKLCTLLPVLMLYVAGVTHAQTQFMERVKADFAKKCEMLPQGNLFRIFHSRALTTAERDMLTFLYAYMPVGDITDYSGEFYLQNVRSAFATREETSWGKQIPDMIFRHFVVPVRVNNENLDGARMAFHDELMPRVRRLSMYDAVLEVNHWCHEKVSYQPSDARTSAPLATVKTAFGRCGEESTFLVAALRAVGIPARQVYTPRWAHTDDNHAWVEAWVDGKWYFLGACEPEPVLNLGWFNAPASRGMLMHTKVFGHYEGPEEVMRTTANYTEINVIGNYAQNARLCVKVTDEKENPVEGASVQFKIYNYAEFFTVSTQTTGQDGKVYLSAGLGDMMVLATKGERFGLRKVSFGREKEVVLKLEQTVGQEFDRSVDIVPPPEHTNQPPVTPAQRAENDRRFNREDSIRKAYVSSFPDKEARKDFAVKYGYTTEQIDRWIVASRGNYPEIYRYLREAAQRNVRERAAALLATLSEKDFRDTPADVLNDHLYHTPITADSARVLAPRIADEMLTSYRSFLIHAIAAADAERFRENPRQLVDWCNSHITLRDDLCCVGTVISPEGVWKSKVADRHSRDIFFVAVARSLGIPAWLDSVTGIVMYRHHDQDFPVTFDRHVGTDAPVSFGTLTLDYMPRPRLDDPEYARHFTLSRFENGAFSLQTFPEFGKWSALFASPVQLPAGYYMLVSGTRQADGSVLGHVSCFTVPKNGNLHTELVIRDHKEKIQVIGPFDSHSVFVDAENLTKHTVREITGKGNFILGILGVGQEPTNHALKDIAARADELEVWGRKIILLLPDKAAYDKYLSDPIEGLPENVVFGYDTDNSISNQLRKNLKIDSNAPLPLFILADTDNQVFFERNGYTIGLGDQLIKVINEL